MERGEVSLVGGNNVVDLSYFNPCAGRTFVLSGWICTFRDIVVFLNLLQKPILHFYVDMIKTFH